MRQNLRVELRTLLAVIAIFGVTFGLARVPYHHLVAAAWPVALGAVAFVAGRSRRWSLDKRVLLCLAAAGTAYLMWARYLGTQRPVRCPVPGPARPPEDSRRIAPSAADAGCRHDGRWLRPRAATGNIRLDALIAESLWRRPPAPCDAAVNRVQCDGSPRR